MSEESDLGVIREPLTPRQRRVLELIGKGYTNHQIAQDLGITLDGAKWHVREILTKLGVDSREEAAAWYERRRTPAARLQHALRALAPPAAALKLAGATAGIAALVALGIAAAIAVTSDGNPTQAVDTGEPTPATTAGASPAASPSPIANFGGVPVREWMITAPEAVPEGLALYLTTNCEGCDSPTASLQRIVRMGEGIDSHVETDTIFTAPGEGDAYILSIEPLGGGGSVFATVCSRGYCGGVGEPTNDAQTTLYRSTNGGVTWFPLETYDGWVRIAGLTQDGLALVAIGRTPGDVHYFVYETGQALPTVEDASWQQHTIGRQFAWRTEEGDLVSSAGTLLFAPPDGWEASLLGPSTADGGHFAVGFEPNDGRANPNGVGIVADEQLLRVFTGHSVSIGGWLSESVAVGNAVLQAREIPGMTSAGSSSYWIPSLIDFEAGTITPIETDGPLFDGEPHGQDLVVAAARGTWHKAAAGNECLRLRSEPSLGAPIVACYSDGVLLDFAGVTAEADGSEWGRFTGPDGHAGWSNLEFVRD